MKKFIYLIIVFQILLMAGICYMFNSVSTAYLIGINNSAEIQRVSDDNRQIRKEVQYLTHPETQMNRMVDYLYGRGEFK